MGKPPVNWTALRNQASKLLDREAGAKAAVNAKAYRDANYPKDMNPAVIAKLERAKLGIGSAKEAKAAAKQAGAGKAPGVTKPVGPGQHHDEHGRFVAGGG